LTDILIFLRFFDKEINIFAMSAYKKNLRGDLFGGLTAGIVALPLALAFGEQSGLGATAGLYGAAFIAFFAAMLGGTATQISGPTAPMTVLSASIISAILIDREGEIEQALPLILLVFILSGIIQILLGLAKIGTNIKYIPKPVVSGFMSGIGVIILITQFMPAVGYKPKNDNELIKASEEKARISLMSNKLDEFKEKLPNDLTNSNNKPVNFDLDFTEEQIRSEAQKLINVDSSGVIGSLKYYLSAISKIDYTEAIITILSIIIIYGFKRITTLVPSALVALIVITLGVSLIDIEYTAISKISAGIPKPNLEIFSISEVLSLAPYIIMALLLSLLGAIDSLLTSLVADNMTKTRHNPNKELIGQGIGNSIAAIFGGLPGAGATIRTVVNIKSGGTTKLSGMISGILLFCVILALGPLASKIPAAVLAGILITVGIDVMDMQGFRELKLMKKEDAIVLLTVLALTVFWQLVYAVAVGFIIALFQYIKKTSDMSESTFEIDNSDVDAGIVQVNLNGPLFFGNSLFLKEIFSKISDKTTKLKINMSGNEDLDYSSISSIRDVLTELKNKNIKVEFSNLSEEAKSVFNKFKLI
jgi:SulP family sulfate permease